MSSYGQRIARAQDVLRAEGLAAAVFAPTDQMRYLTGWAESGHERLLALLLPANGEPVFVVPAINAAQARRNPAAIPDVRGWDDSTGWHSLVAELLKQWGVEGRGLAVDDELQSIHLLGLQAIAPGVRCVPAGGLMSRLREVKAAEEIAALERSAAATDAVYEEALGALHTGVTELDVEEAVAQGYRRRGTRPGFAIICFGPNTALPHHHTGQAPLRDGDMVIFDIGCALDGYWSDITRTIAFGRSDPEAHRVYEVVYAAHRAALERSAPGVPCQDVDRTARAIIREGGYGEYFIHRTGHGIGLSGHEDPYIVEGNTRPLEPGMCFSDEPGIYLPGRFGVRIENIVTVETAGARSLNAAPPDTLTVLDAS